MVLEAIYDLVMRMTFVMVFKISKVLIIVIVMAMKTVYAESIDNFLVLTLVMEFKIPKLNCK